MRKTVFAALTLILTGGFAMAEEISTGEWQLLAMNGALVTAEATFAIDADGKVSGLGACNRYFGSNAETLPKLSLAQMGMTQMYCDQRMEQEAAYMKALQGVTAANLQDDHLLLTGPDDVVLEFVRDRDDKGMHCLSCK